MRFIDPDFLKDTNIIWPFIDDIFGCFYILYRLKICHISISGLFDLMTWNNCCMLRSTLR